MTVHILPVVGIACAAVALTSILAWIPGESSRTFAVVFALLLAATWRLLSRERTGPKGRGR
jgi:hypothetical protein